MRRKFGFPLRVTAVPFCCLRLLPRAQSGGGAALISTELKNESSYTLTSQEAGTTEFCFPLIQMVQKYQVTVTGLKIVAQRVLCNVRIPRIIFP